jgi:opacity protein-like surface antigen
VKAKKLLLGALCLVLAAGAAVAHHSTAMFDMQHTVTLSGTVTQFDWTNPHTFIFMEVMNNGATESWSIEGMSPNYLSRNGWTRHTLKPGDKIGMEVHLLKDGRKGGFCATVTLPDGKKLNNLPARPGTAPSPDSAPK